MNTARPRHYAESILAGESSIDDVPEEFRGQVIALLRLREDQIAFWAASVLRGINREARVRLLGNVPEALRAEVEKRCREAWGQA